MSSQTNGLNSNISGFIENRSALYGRAELRRLIEPKSIAVIGASESAGSFGARTMENLATYSGRLYPINAKRSEVFGHRCFASIEDLPESPDAVIVSVPKEHAQELVERCANKGAGGAIVYSSGFAELGTIADVRAQRALAETAHRSGMRIIGPNCVGIINFASSIGMHFMPKFNEMPQVSGRIGLVSQSGGLGYTIVQSLQRGIGYSHFLSAGNSCDVDIADLINYLVDDRSTDVIACLFEGIRDGDRFVAAGKRALEAGKPLIVYKMGLSDISKKAALSHTGTLAGTNAAYEAALLDIGAVRVDNWEEVLETACLFERAGKPQASGVGVMASSGGAAVISADKAEEFNVPMPPPERQTIETLSKLVPDFGSIANPTDMTAETLKSFELYSNCIRAFADDPNYAAVVVPMLSAQKPTTTDRALHLDQLSKELTKPICLIWFNEWLEGPGSEIYDRSSRISIFRSMARCMKALRCWFDYYAIRPALLKRNAAVPPFVHRPAARKRASDIVQSKPAGRVLSEEESKSVIAQYDIATNPATSVSSAGDAITHAETIGYPVVLKVDAPVAHKTEAGLVKLSLGSANDVRRAFSELLSAISKLETTSPSITVQKMVSGDYEMFVGATVDSQFGPIVSCGFGGIEIEIMQDVCTRRAPVDLATAEEMVRSLKRSQLLYGFRSRPAVDVTSFARMICHASELIADCRAEISELDINPILLSAGPALAVDALIVPNSSGNAHE